MPIERAISGEASVFAEVVSAVVSSNATASGELEAEIKTVKEASKTGQSSVPTRLTDFQENVGNKDGAFAVESVTYAVDKDVASDVKDASQPSVPARITHFQETVLPEDLTTERKFKAGRTMIKLGFDSKQVSVSYFRAIAKHPVFDLISAALIMGSTALIGIETNYASTHGGSSNTTYNNFGLLLCMLFTVELLLRVLASGSGFLTTDPDYLWNIFDTGMVLSGIIEVFLEVSGLGSSSASTGRVLRILRIIRITRAMRMGRIMKYARTFKQIAFALQSSVATLFWALVMIFLIMYCFAIAMCQAATFHLKELRESPEGMPHPLPSYLVTLVHSYSDVPNSIYSLFMSMTGGKNWGELASPILEISGLYGGLLFSMFASSSSEC
jgi:hypothetical protein